MRTALFLLPIPLLFRVPTVVAIFLKWKSPVARFVAEDCGIR